VWVKFPGPRFRVRADVGISQGGGGGVVQWNNKGVVGSQRTAKTPIEILGRSSFQVTNNKSISLGLHSKVAKSSY